MPDPIYLDNAATTAVAKEVFEAMTPYLLEEYGNPSSLHSKGRSAKAAIESARKKIAHLLNCQPGELIFTSSGTEANNASILGCVKKYGIKNIISTPIEHHAVLNTLRNVQNESGVTIHFLNVDKYGRIDLIELEGLLKTLDNALVSIMYANNEIGAINPVAEIGVLCKQHDAKFQTDVVQAISHYRIDLSELEIDYLSASAHKFHGPKGTGLLYNRQRSKLPPFLFGGKQEREMRAGTENVAGIVGMAAALDLCYQYMERDRRHMEQLKSLLIKDLKSTVEGISFNGDADNFEHALYNVLSINLPKQLNSQLLLFQLDLKGICVSGGSACASGALQGSHVISAVDPENEGNVIRVSLSKYNTEKDIHFFIKALKEELEHNT